MKQTRQRLTVGDGFRVGFGIAFWLVIGLIVAQNSGTILDAIFILLQRLGS